jgi:hypothetical protein
MYWRMYICVSGRRNLSLARGFGSSRSSLVASHCFPSPANTHHLNLSLLQQLRLSVPIHNRRVYELGSRLPGLILQCRVVRRLPAPMPWPSVLPMVRLPLVRADFQEEQQSLPTFGWQAPWTDLAVQGGPETAGPGASALVYANDTTSSPRTVLS